MHPRTRTYPRSYLAFSKEFLLPEVIAESAATTGLRPKMPKHWPPQVRELLEALWNGDPKLRPPFTEVVSQLEAIQRDPEVMAAIDGKSTRKSSSGASDGAPSPRPEGPVPGGGSCCVLQ